MRHFITFFLCSLALAPCPSLAESPTAATPVSGASAAPVAAADLKLELTVAGFSEPNATAIRAHEADLRVRLRAVVGDSAGAPVAVRVELAGGAVLVTVDEVFPGKLDGLDLAPGPMGHRMLVSTRAWRAVYGPAQLHRCRPTRRHRWATRDGAADCVPTWSQ